MGPSWRAPVLAGLNSPVATRVRSIGYYTSGGCGLNTRDVQQLTGGFWYDFYKGPKGRLREGFQYAYAVRAVLVGRASRRTD